MSYPSRIKIDLSLSLANGWPNSQTPASSWYNSSGVIICGAVIGYNEVVACL